MNNSIEDYQEIIPEFVVKLYHILDVKFPIFRIRNIKTRFVGLKMARKF